MFRKINILLFDYRLSRLFSRKLATPSIISAYHNRKNYGKILERQS
jgi:hypothetical protein